MSPELPEQTSKNGLALATGSFIRRIFGRELIFRKIVLVYFVTYEPCA